ncbi:telomerase reverse transcriptase [Pancytospora philotis]|nr:telomerase reverse transcriptase [Pancytospora philotis]
MQSILQRLGFAELRQFIRTHFSTDCCCEGIYVRCDTPVPRMDPASRVSSAEIIGRAFELADSANQLRNGYSAATQSWYSTNTATNLLRTPRWSAIFEAIGDESSLFILTRCAVVEEVHGELVLICGNFNKLAERKSARETVCREQLFFGKQGLEPLALAAIEEYAMGGLKGYAALKQSVSGCLASVVQRYNRLPLVEIFRSFFSKKMREPSDADVCAQSFNESLVFQTESSFAAEQQPDDSLNPSEISYRPDSLLFSDAHEEPAGARQDGDIALPYDAVIGFLFLIAKKSLRPIFSLRDFRILKGKLTLLVKRNQFEGIAADELRKHFRLSKMKIFAGSCTKHEFAARCRIAERLLLYLFNTLFIRLMTHFFYSTVCANSRYRVAYYKRTLWNARTAQHYKEFLRNFKPAARHERMGSLRCIPKPGGFRVITNCSAVYSQGNGRACKRVSARRRGGQSRGAGSINTAAAPFLPLFNLLARGNLGNSITGHSEMHKRLYDHLSLSQGRQYLVKLDVAQCFENITHADLLDALPQLFKAGGYFVSDYTAIHINQIGTGCEYRSVRKASEYLRALNTIVPGYLGRTGALTECVGPAAARVAGTGACGSIIREVRHRYYTRDELLSGLNSIVQGSVICHQNSCYSFTKGIPQGCVISPMLCNLYYAAHDLKYFAGLFSRGVVLRYVDDFLIITPSLDEVRDFFRLARSLQSRGYAFNPSKAETNICPEVFAQIYQSEYERPGQQQSAHEPLRGASANARTAATLSGSTGLFAQDSIVWCGKWIFDSGINIKNRLSDRFFRYSVYLAPGCHGRRIFSKVAGAFRVRTTRTFINFRNGKLGENIYDTFFFLGRRIRILFRRADFVNPRFLEFVLSWCVEQMVLLLGRRKILFDSAKVHAMAEKAFRLSSARSVYKEPWR